METTKNEQELNITNISEAETNINNLNNTSKKYVIDMKEKKDELGDAFGRDGIEGC